MVTQAAHGHTADTTATHQAQWPHDKHTATQQAQRPNDEQQARSSPTEHYLPLHLDLGG